MKLLLLFLPLLPPILDARGDSIFAGTICAGAASLSNGSVVSIGQPLVGFSRDPSGGSVNAGLLPLSEHSPVANPIIDIATASLSFAHGIFSLEISTEPGRLYTLEASSNLTLWVPVNSQRAMSSLLNLTDTPDATLFQYRYYRVSTSP